MEIRTVLNRMKDYRIMKVKQILAIYNHFSALVVVEKRPMIPLESTFSVQYK